MVVRLFSLVVLLSLLALCLLPAVASAEVTTTLFEHHNTGDGNYSAVYGDNWCAQTFTTSATYAVDYVRVKLTRVGDPGTVSVALKATDGGEPTGSNLCYAALDAYSYYGTPYMANSTAWYTFDFTDRELEYNTVYAVVTYAIGAGIPDEVQWRYDNTGTYTGGSRWTSTDSGVSWVEQVGDDMMFEVWGRTDLSLNSVQIWSDYQEPDDWLITVYYTNRVAPEYRDRKSPEKTWVIQYLNGNCTEGNVTAQSPIRFWGDSVASIYLNANEAADLDWGGNASVRLYSSTTSVCANVTADDWRGENMYELDAWCVATADDMGIRNNAVYTVDVAGKGKLLAQNIGQQFETGIPGLMAARGDGLFEQLSRTYNRPTPTFNPAMQAESQFETRMGPYVVASVKNLATAIGIPWQIIAFLGVAVIYFLMAMRGVPVGHAVAGAILSEGFLFIGLYTGTFQWIWFSLIAVISAGLFVYHLFATKT